MTKHLLFAILGLLLPVVAAAQPFVGNVTPPVFVLPASAVNGGGVFSGQLLAPTTPTDCSVPQYSFVGDTDTGMAYHSSNVWQVCGGATSIARFTAAGPLVEVGTSGGASVQIGSSGGSGILTLSDGSGNTTSARPEAANHWFQRNGTNAQRVSWALRYGGAADYESFSIDAGQTVSNVVLVGTRTAATGTVRPLMLVSQASSASNAYAAVRVDASSVPRIRIGATNAAGSFGADMGGSGTYIQVADFTNSQTSGAQVAWAITPTYNQSASTAANTDFKVERTETSVGTGPQYSLTLGDDGNIRAYVTSGGATGRGTQTGWTQAAVPTCSTNCGTSPSVVGSDTAMRVTMGSSGSPASGWVVTFNGTWAAAPICDVTMAKAGMVAGKMALTVVTTTTTLTVVTNGTAPATTDIYSINCWGVQ